MRDEPIEAWMDATSALMGLPVDSGNRAEVLSNLRRLADLAARLEAVALDPEVEPLVVFVR
jgi:hypothetical protein